MLAGARAIVRTPSGGLHVYFAGSSQPCGRLPGRFLDFKARGGYVPAPPSVVGAIPYVLVDHRAADGRLDWQAVRRVLVCPPSPRPPGPKRCADVSALVGWVAGLAEGDVLAGEYLSTDKSPCDVENRLYTNPGASSFPKDVSSIRFERGPGEPPDPPIPVTRVNGHLYYYRYHLGGTWQWREPGVTLARWHRVTRRLPDDGSCRPVWLAMKQAAAAGQIEVLGSAPGDAQPFGIRIVVHATPRGPRRVAAISESVIDGTIAAFHAGTSTSAAASVAAALAPHLPGVDPASIETLAAMSSPGPCSPHPHLRSKAHMCRSARVTSDATSGR